MLRLLIVTLVTAIAIGTVHCQSNYGSQANNVEYEGEGLPEQTVLDGKVTKLDDLSPIIFLNRTKAALNCAAGSMQVELKFNERFYGIAYADFDRNSACRVSGNGDFSYKIELPLKGCGTRQDPQRVFTNNIVVRFHPGLEMDGDEVITIVCRYPPPIAPIPPVPNYFKVVRPESSKIPAPLNGFQILLIICAILFLSLVLLGLAASYYCLRRRHLTVIRHQPFAAESGSEITKLSGSSLDNLSMFEGLKIPRAQTQLTAATASNSGSEGPLISDTLPSDYPSESHSEIEDMDTRSLPVSSTGSFENKGYVHEMYQESYHQRESTLVPGQPKFDVQMRVKRAPPPPSPSDSDSSINRTERNLTTILEQREDSSSRERTQFTYVPDIHPPPRSAAPIYSKIHRRQQEMSETTRRYPQSEWSEQEETRMMRTRSLTSLNTEMTDTHSMVEMVDSTQHKLVPPPPPPKPSKLHMSEYAEERILQTATHQPEITSHVVDDVFLKTITEKRTIEDIERHKRLITEYHTRVKPRPPPEPEQKWDVTIRNISEKTGDLPDWENFSDISSASNMTLTPKMERANLTLPPQSLVEDKKIHLTSPELVGSVNQGIPIKIPDDVPLENPQIPNWNVLLRVLKPGDEDNDLASQLTPTDQIKWQKIITTESNLRTMLTEASVREDYERIRYDKRYENLFDPHKWDVIIRILSPNEKNKNNRYRKKSDWDTRSRRSSLPTLYEYDSDGSSLKTVTNEPIMGTFLPRARKNSKSSYRSEVDLRSMSEMTVDFAKQDYRDDSDGSSYYQPAGRYYDEYEMELNRSDRSLNRSLSQPSLARSASEFTERWIAPSEYTSPETTPKSQRSSRISKYDGRNHFDGSKVINKKYVSESTSTSYQKRGGWYDDNDSE